MYLESDGVEDMNSRFKQQYSYLQPHDIRDIQSGIQCALNAHSSVQDALDVNSSIHDSVDTQSGIQSASNT